MLTTPLHSLLRGMGFTRAIPIATRMLERFGAPYSTVPPKDCFAGLLWHVCGRYYSVSEKRYAVAVLLSSTCVVWQDEGSDALTDVPIWRDEVLQQILTMISKV